MSIHTAILINGAIASTCSLFLNVLLAYLVLKHTPTQMRGYGRVMLMHCVCDVIFDLVNFAIGPVSFYLFVNVWALKIIYFTSLLYFNYF